MANSSDKKSAKAIEIIQGLFSQPPASMEEFQLRTKKIDPAAGCDVLLQMIKDGSALELPHELILLLANEFKMGVDPASLLGLIQDEGYDESQRTMALMILLGTNPEAMHSQSFNLNESIMENLAQSSHEMVLGLALKEAGGGEEFTQLLIDVEPLDREDAFRRLELGRRELMVPAWLLFQDALQVAELQPLHREMVELIALETRATGVDVWDDLLQQDLPRETRSMIQSQLMRWRTSLLNSTDKEKPAPFFTAPATAWICPCDGVGAYVILLCVQLESGKVSIHNVCLRTTGELRDGFIVPFVSLQDFEEMVEIFRDEQNQEFVEFPLSKAVELVSRARVSPLNEKGVGMVENLNAAACLQWAATMATAEDENSRLQAMAFPHSTGDFSHDELHKLFTHPDLEPWFLNAEDLDDLGLEAVGPQEMDRAWLDKRVDKVNTPEIRENLRGMLQHMAWFYCWDEEPHMAGFCSGAAKMLDGEESAFTVMMHYLLKSFQMNRRNEETKHQPRHLEVGDSGMRENLRILGFPRLSNPKGKHMAILDFSEAAQVVIEQVVDEYATHRQPRQDVLPLIALAIGKAQADMCLSGRSGFDLGDDGRRFQRMINAIVKVSNFNADEAAKLWMAVVPSLESFVSRVCRGCSVGCLERPTGDMREWFYSGEHPGFLGE